LALPHLGVQRLQNLVALLKVALTGYRAWRLWHAAAKDGTETSTTPPQ
jgi:hypothetical protein